jgi:predicted lactoylglutathione lyase
MQMAEAEVEAEGVKRFVKAKGANCCQELQQSEIMWSGEHPDPEAHCLPDCTQGSSCTLEYGFLRLAESMLD